MAGRRTSGAARERIERRGVAGIEENEAADSSAPASEFRQPRAFWRGLFGANDGGGRVLRVGTNGARFRAVKLLQSSWEETETQDA